LGIDRVLSSGQEATCVEGLEILAALQQQGRGRIIILPGGGITPRNARKIVEGAGVSEIHLSARKSVESGMRFRNSRVFMGGTLGPPEFSWKCTDEAAVRNVVQSCARRG
jgi:copper homeostasis protein